MSTQHHGPSAADVSAIVRHALAGECADGPDPATVRDDAGIGSEQLPVTSMGYLRALVAIEERLGVPVADALLEEVRRPSVGDVVAYVKAALEGSR